MSFEPRAKDVAALLDRAGLHETGTYREFGKIRDAILVNSEQEKSSISTGHLRVLGRQAGAAVAQFSPLPDQGAPVFDRLLGRKRPRSGPLPATAARIALFSLAGGVGKTTLTMALGRILSGRGRGVVLVNCGSSFAWQHLLGPRAQRVGGLTFLHMGEGPAVRSMTLIEADEAATPEAEERAMELVQQASIDADAALLDLPSGTCSRNLDLAFSADHVLVPILPNLHSAATLRSVDSLLQSGRSTETHVHYVLNRYDPSRALHREMHDRLQSILGDALLPLYIREEPLVEDAMQNGLTVVDYAPDAEMVADLRVLGRWIEQLTPRHPALKEATL
ncbi:MAG TPA: cellulose synthase operon protein YhjQ/BcsQ [Acidisarcina sp.]